MPQKTIYIKDENLEIFEEAEKKLPGSLSESIAEALKKELERVSAEEKGLKEQSLKIGKWGNEDMEEIRFFGRLIFSDYVDKEEFGEDEGLEYGLFEGEKGKFLLHRNKHGGDNPKAEYFVFDDLKDIKSEDVPELPEGFMVESRKRLENEVKWLNI